MLGGRPFFKGRDYVDQLNQILHILGTPNEETLCRIGSPRAQEYVRNLPHMAKRPFPTLFPNANPDALNLLDHMLAFDPSSRISVEEALEHPYLHIWHDASDEPGCPTTFNFDFEVVEDVGEMRKMIGRSDDRSGVSDDCMELRIELGEALRAGEMTREEAAVIWENEGC